MAAINYLDFDLLIERAEAGYQARVLRCPAVPTTSEFALPFEATRVRKLGYRR